MTRLLRNLLLVGIVMLVTATARSAPPAAPSTLDFFAGVTVPLNATQLFGPEASFRVAGWSSDWGQLKLMELAKDGDPVDAGAVVARFEFGAKDAQRWIEERIQKAKADAAQSKITSEQTVEGLYVDQRRRKLEAQLAALDVQKERLVSKKQASLHKITHQIAAFEEEAVSKRLGAALRARSAELAFQDESVSRAVQDMGRYTFYENRFTVKAPHAGIVRHAFNARERRKVQKGDSISPGQKLVAVAKDSALAARFFVPEYRLNEVSVGQAVKVVSTSSGEELRATVKSIDFFPQELGFLLELPNSPTAREKAFAVVAEFDAVPEGLAAGTELRVRMVRP